MSTLYFEFTNPVVAGTVIRSDKYNSDMQKVQTFAEAAAEDISRRIELPTDFSGDPKMPALVADSLLRLTPTGFVYYPTTEFNAAVNSALNAASQASSSQTAAAGSATQAAASAANAYTSMLLAQQAAGVATGGLYFAGTFNGAEYPPVPEPGSGIAMYISTGENPALNIAVDDFVFYDHMNLTWRLIPGITRAEDAEIFSLAGI